MMFFKFNRSNQVSKETLPDRGPTADTPDKSPLPETVNTADLARIVAVESSITMARANQILGAFLEAILVSLEEGKKVRLSGFGQFNVRRSKRNKFRNPRTGGRVNAVARATVCFRPSAKLKDAMNPYEYSGLIG